MISIEVKFETEADKESFIESVVDSFNRSGKDKSVWANTVSRTGETLFFTRQVVEEPTTQELSDELKDFDELKNISPAHEGESRIGSGSEESDSSDETTEEVQVNANN